MVVALVVVVIVAIVAVSALSVVARRASVARHRAEGRVDQLNGRLAEAVDLLEESDKQRRAAEARSTAAEGRTRAAEQKAHDAERRSGEAEKRIGEAIRRSDEAVRAAVASDPARTVWELEKLRVEREWMDVVGPGVDLPVPWDGSIRAVVATELSVIREVMGTPSELALAGHVKLADPARAAVTARVSVEMLRRLARSGDEMDVSVTADALTVVQPVHPDETPTDLSGLAEVAGRAGLSLAHEVADGRLQARLSI
ncbi:MAG TPA: hypothetical protein VG435_02275 [Acidimicrobiales bacterium]|jgi:hypothetical protein|nr:hypothetical protein [Acidimicrobiales bacterium]